MLIYSNTVVSDAHSESSKYLKNMFMGNGKKKKNIYIYLHDKY